MGLKTNVSKGDKVLIGEVTVEITSHFAKLDITAPETTGIEIKRLKGEDNKTTEPGQDWSPERQAREKLKQMTRG